jgi:CheY-like chemotaxis protein
MLAYSGKGRFVVSSLDLGELLRENANLFRSAVAKSITMDLRLAAEGCMVEANPSQIQQVIMNLITNASEAIGEGAGTITLSTGLLSCDEAYLTRSRLEEKAPPGDYVYVEVRDNGCGMDAETVQRVFDPFFTTKFTGRGLGMSAVLGIVRGHRGALMVDSVQGRGTTVRVLLPASGAPTIQEPRGQAPAKKTSVDPSPTGTILVVDDEPTVREICAEYAEQLGYRALSAADGKGALALYREHGHDIACVLLDLTMPQMDGLSTFRELRRMRPDVKVILCSGYDEQDAVRRFAREGLSGFLHKPYLLHELEARLDEALDTRGNCPPRL